MHPPSCEDVHWLVWVIGFACGLFLFVRTGQATSSPANQRMLHKRYWYRTANLAQWRIEVQRAYENKEIATLQYLAQGLNLSRLPAKRKSELQASIAEHIKSLKTNINDEF